MAKRAFDILPPYQREEPRTYHHHGDNNGKTKKRSLGTFLGFVFGLVLIFILFTFSKNNGLNITNNTEQKKTDNTANSFELFDNKGESNLSNQTGIISVKLQDASSNGANLSTVKDKLLKAGFEIASTEKAALIANQTTINYKKGDLATAQKVLKTLPNAVTQESSTLENTYDLLVIIGDK